MLAEIIFSRFKTGYEGQIEDVEKDKLHSLGTEAGIEAVISPSEPSSEKHDILQSMRKRTRELNEVKWNFINKRQRRLDLANQVWMGSALLGIGIGAARALGWLQF